MKFIIHRHISWKSLYLRSRKVIGLPPSSLLGYRIYKKRYEKYYRKQVRKAFANLIHRPRVTPQHPQMIADKMITADHRRIVADSVIQGAFPQRISNWNVAIPATSFIATATIEISMAHDTEVISAVIMDRMSANTAYPCIREKKETMAERKHSTAQMG